MSKIVEIVWDAKKRKLRATPTDAAGWVRFPNALRVEGAKYKVSDLRQGAGGSWIACGLIEPYDEATVTKVRKSITESPKPVPKPKPSKSDSFDLGEALRALWD